MKFTFEVEEGTVRLRTYLKKKGFSRRLLSRIIQDSDDNISVNEAFHRLNEYVETGDKVEISLPPEERHPRIIPSKKEIDILYEDDHLLILNKEPGLLSTVSWEDPDEAITNRILGYYIGKSYPNQTIHLVTRLDRYTSGAMIIAKHQLAHAKMDQLLRKGEIDKEYYAIVPPSKDVIESHGFIDEPIGRSKNSIIEHEVSPDGKESLTEYQRLETLSEGDLLKVRLHTGRTHQIRVHFSHIGLPLIGDTLYGGTEQKYLKRQALHCSKLTFRHPFTHEKLEIETPLPEDMENWLKAQEVQFKR